MATGVERNPDPATPQGKPRPGPPLTSHTPQEGAQGSPLRSGGLPPRRVVKNPINGKTHNASGTTAPRTTTDRERRALAGAWEEGQGPKMLGGLAGRRGPPWYFCFCFPRGGGRRKRAQVRLAVTHQGGLRVPRTVVLRSRPCAPLTWWGDRGSKGGRFVNLSARSCEPEAPRHGTYSWAVQDGPPFLPQAPFGMGGLGSGLLDRARTYPARSEDPARSCLRSESRVTYCSPP